jgi:S1-C subfamily serine protease
MRPFDGRSRIDDMNTDTLNVLSEQMAEAVAAIGPSVVQVHGRRRPVSGVAYASGTVLTTSRALGREDDVRVTTENGQESSAALAGWDPASGLAVLQVEAGGLPPAKLATAPARVGQLALGAARSWSNALTATAGIVAVIGGPLRTGRGQSLEQIIRVTAPMHDGFAGGPVFDATGGVIGIATAAQIRGLTVVIPAAIAWKSAAHVLKHGRPRMGFLGVSGHRVELPDGQRGEGGRNRGLLVIGVTPGGPAEAGGVLIGDLILALDQQPVESTDDLLRLLTAERVGRSVPLQVQRGGTVRELTVTIGERPAS